MSLPELFSSPTPNDLHAVEEHGQSSHMDIKEKDIKKKHLIILTAFNLNIGAALSGDPTGFYHILCLLTSVFAKSYIEFTFNRILHKSDRMLSGRDS
jgi:hypothetical protein